MSGAVPSQAAPPRAAERAPGAAAGAVRAGRASAVLFATTPAVDGGPAAALHAGGTTILARLLAQLGELGVRRAWVVTRPQWRAALEALRPESGIEVTVVPSEDLADDLRAAADVAEHAGGSLLLARADALTQREALAGLLADPRIVSGILVSASSLRGAWGFRTRSARGRIVSAGSAYHRVGSGGAFFLGVLKVDARDRAALVAVTRRLAELAGAPPAGWQDELAAKAAEWRHRLWRAAQPGPPAQPPDPATWHALPLDPETEAALARRVHAAREDAVSLLLVGLVRSDVVLASRHLRGFFYGRPVSAEAAAAAVDELRATDEDRIALDAAVKGSDGFFTTFFVSPYSRYLARFAARRGWTPNAITTLSMAIGLLAAAAFATGSRPGLVAGAVLLQVAFTADCVDGQLARYTRQFSKLGAWLDSVFDRGKEYVVYAGLALGAWRGFGEDVWALAAAALTMQTVRHVLDFAYAAGQREVIAATPQPPLEDPWDAASAHALAAGGRRPRALGGRLPPAALPALAAAAAGGGPATAQAGARPPALAADDLAAPAASAPPAPAPRRSAKVTAVALGRRALRLVGRLERWPWTRWGKRILVLPIGERFALVSLTAALFTPRVTFIALLAWGAVAFTYALVGRSLRSLAR
jgi:phosphatidylglycerophosphate synthase